MILKYGGFIIFFRTRYKNTSVVEMMCCFFLIFGCTFKILLTRSTNEEVSAFSRG